MTAGSRWGRSSRGGARWGIVASLSLAALAAPARADEPPGCPPGEWFCAEEEEAAAEGPDELPPPGDELEPVAPEPEAEEGSIALEGSEAPTSRRWSEGSGGRPRSPWALALRVEGVIADSPARGEDTRLGGVGVSGRYSLSPGVSLDLGLDSILGTDYNGYDRSELMLSFSGLLFLNRHPVVRTYVLAGLNASSATVDVDGDDQSWGYFGGQAGLGLEIALDPQVALGLDALAFMRGRTDARAEREPEFTDERGRVTNTSGGGLLRGGVVLRF